MKYNFIYVFNIEYKIPYDNGRRQIVMIEIPAACV